MMNNSNFLPPPNPNDVPGDLGPYSRQEIVRARSRLLGLVDQERSAVWFNLKYKLGILPNNWRTAAPHSQQVWIPTPTPAEWSAPVTLVPEREDGEVTDDDAEEASPGQPARKRKRAEDGESRASASSSRSSCTDNGLPGGGSPPDSPAARRRKWDPSLCGEEDSSRSSSGSSRTSQGEGNEKYQVLFACDLCAFSCAQEAGMLEHLEGRQHFSASQYLGKRPTPDEQPEAEYLYSASRLTVPEHMFKDKVPSCGTCGAVFVSVSDCVEHGAQRHGQTGTYSLRSVLGACRVFTVLLGAYKCMDCGQRFGMEASLKKHVSDTNHMALACQTELRGRLTCFPCQYCRDILYNYHDYRRHLCRKHLNQFNRKGETAGACFEVSGPQPPLTLLPLHPHIPTTSIHYDFDLQTLRHRDRTQAKLSRLNGKSGRKKKNKPTVNDIGGFLKIRCRLLLDQEYSQDRKNNPTDQKTAKSADRANVENFLKKTKASQRLRRRRKVKKAMEEIGL